MEVIRSRVTILPAQARLLATLTTASNAAMGIEQIGSVLFLDTGRYEFAINALGQPIDEKEANAQKEHHLRKFRRQRGD